MPTDALLLHARNLARRHPDGRSWLLHGISLQLAAGTRLAVAGPSGAGKTLLLRAVARLDTLDEGEVLFDGQPVRRDAVPGFRSRVIYLHQRPALLAENVEAALRRPFALRVHRGKKYDRERAVELLEELGRDETFLNKRAADLSGGEGQIAALVRALILDPAVLLLDEPTASLDPATATAVEELVLRWIGEQPDGRAFVWVAHAPGQTGRVAERTLSIAGGRMKEP